MQKKRVTILDIPFDNISMPEAVKCIFTMLEKKGKHHIATPNPEILLEAKKNPELRKILKNTALNIPDGTGIIFASKFQKTPLTERVTGTDLMIKICEESREKGYKVFLLGAQTGVAEMAQRELENRFPGIQICGSFAGIPDKKHDKEIQEMINYEKPDILFVAYGCPKQELWIHRNLSHLTTVRIAMGVGGAFDFIAKIRKRSPKWMQKAGLEWTYRLIQEPKRIGRIYNAVIKFPIAFFKNRKKK